MITESWTVIATSFLFVALSLNFGVTVVQGKSCSTDSTCFADFGLLQRCCGGQCHGYEYCQDYHWDEWEKKDIYKEHYTLVCGNDYTCEVHADAKVYLSKNEVECCNGKCRTEKACNGSAVVAIILIILGCCCCVFCVAGIIGAIYFFVLKSNESNNYRGVVRGAGPKPEAYYEPSPPSYTPAHVPAANSYPENGHSGYPTANLGFQADDGGFSGHGGGGYGGHGSGGDGFGGGGFGGGDGGGGGGDCGGGGGGDCGGGE